MSTESESTAGGVVAGLSIDDDSLRVVVIERGDEPTVIEVAEADLGPDTVRDGRVSDQLVLARRIGELWHALNLGGVPTFLGLHPIDGEAHVVAVAGWPQSGWPSEVRAAAAQRRRELDAEPVWNADRFDSDGGPVARIVSCRREDLSSAVWAARRSGVWLAGVELSALAVERVLLAGPQLLSLLVDTTGTGPVMVLLLQAGVAVRCWRAPRTASDADALTLVPLDATTAQAVLREPAYPWAELVAGRTAVSAPARLVGPGRGLAATSPVPRPGFAAAFGLALAAAGVGAVPVDLQPALLHAGAARLQARMGSLSVAALSSLPPAAAPPPPPAVVAAAPTAVAPIPPVAPIPAAVPVAEVAMPSPSVQDQRSVALSAPPVGPLRTLAVEAFLAGPGPLVVPNGPDLGAVAVSPVGSSHGSGAASAAPTGSTGSTGSNGPAAVGAMHEGERPAAPVPVAGVEAGKVATDETTSAGVESAASTPTGIAQAEIAPAADAPAGVAPAEIDPASEETAVLAHRGRRVATVAVVAGAAAVGSFFVVRTVLPDSSGGGEPPTTTEAPATAPNPGRP